MQAVGERLQRIAANRGTTPRHLALRWIMQASGSCIPIVGARSASQMREMLADVTSPLDAQTMQEIDALVTVDPLFPYRLIESSYLRKFALGTPDRFTEVRSPRK
jgi:aryl-alcohol dehydrogenase-like predicted oxidoreductase